MHSCPSCTARRRALEPGRRGWVRRGAEEREGDRSARLSPSRSTEAKALTSWTPSRICLTVMAGFHDFSSLRMETTREAEVSSRLSDLAAKIRERRMNLRQTVPEG